MPELPEVETIKLSLEKRIIGLKIEETKINSFKSFIGDSKKLEGKKVLDIQRKAKVLLINLTGNLTLLFHLKMSGQLIWEKGQRVSALKSQKFIGGHPTQDMAGDMPNKHTRVEFIFSDNSHLYFNDQRRFGWIKIVESLKLKDQSFFQKLGPEPLEEEFTWQVLKQNLLKHKKTAVKVVLLDQSVVSGIGNIYACEACFLAKIDPRKKVDQLTETEFKLLHKGIIESLKNGIKYGGSTKTHFVDAEGKKGFFLDHAFVYGRDKKPCKVCQTKIKKIKLGGRGTFFCPNCQNSL